MRKSQVLLKGFATKGIITADSRKRIKTLIYIRVFFIFGSSHFPDVIMFFWKLIFRYVFYTNFVFWKCKYRAILMLFFCKDDDREVPF